MWPGQRFDLPGSASASLHPAYSTRAPVRGGHHGTGKGAVIRTVGTTPDPVRYLYANQPDAPRIAHASPARQHPQHDVQAPACIDVSAVRKALRLYPTRCWPTAGSSPRIAHGTQPTI
jgi:hypothetical protein